MRLILTTIILTMLAQPVFAGLFDKYPRGKKGHVIAEMRNKDTSKWVPDILFFGGPDEDFNFRRCKEYRDIMNRRLQYYEYRCIPNR